MAKSNSRKNAVAKADKYFSRYIRLKYADDNGMCKCCTSGKRFHWKQIHCGHFQSRRYISTRYDEQNCAPQSPYDNTYKQGEQYKFAKWIDATHGQGTADWLEQKAQQQVKLTAIDLEYIADVYRKKSREIANQKGIEI